MSVELMNAGANKRKVVKLLSGKSAHPCSLLSPVSVLPLCPLPRPAVPAAPEAQPH